MLVMVCLNAPPTVSASEFTSPLWLTHHVTRLVASEVYPLVSTTNICVNRMCRRLYVGK